MSMAWLVALIGLLMAVLGLAVLLNPARLRRALYWFVDSRNIFRVAVLRIAVGALLVLASPYTLLPTLILALGVVIIVVGVVGPLLGRTRLEQLENWWLAVPEHLLRLGGLLGLVLGLLVMWASI